MKNNNTAVNLKQEVENNIGNEPINFKHFEFDTYPLEELNRIASFPFPKYRSFETYSAVVFYKHISRIIER